MSKELRLSQVALIKAVESKDASTLIIRGIASMYRSPDGLLQIDRDEELINLDFLDTDSYKKNPILVVAHQWDRPIGTITSIEKKDGALVVEAEVHKLTGEEAIFEAVQKGILKTFSIGVVPHEYMYRDTAGGGEVLEIARSTLVEISLMPVQSNQEALFDVIATKGVGKSHIGISKKALAEQNGMTCDELDGSCAFKAELKTIKTETQEKEHNMGIKAKEPEQKKQEEPKAQESATKEPEQENQGKQEEAKAQEGAASTDKEPEQKKQEAAPAKVDEEALVAAIQKAEEEKERIAKEKEEEAARKAEEDRVAEEAARKAEVENAINFIKKRKDEIINIPSEEFDVDEVEDFYTLISDTAEAIEEKVTTIVKEQIAS